MKTVTTAKKPFSKGSYSPVKHARYLDWEDAFDVEFDDGLSFLEPHRTIKKANKISAGGGAGPRQRAQEIPLTFQNRVQQRPDRRSFVVVYSRTAAEKFKTMMLDMSDGLTSQSSETPASNDLENTAFNGAELSESVLGRDWNSAEEDAAWSNL